MSDLRLKVTIKIDAINAIYSVFLYLIALQ